MGRGGSRHRALASVLNRLLRHVRRFSNDRTCRSSRSRPRWDFPICSSSISLLGACGAQHLPTCEDAPARAKLSRGGASVAVTKGITLTHAQAFVEKAMGAGSWNRVV